MTHPAPIAPKLPDSGIRALEDQITELATHALDELPRNSAAFEVGKINYSKVRAMTRVATPKNEEFPLMIALHGTASHVERAVSTSSLSTLSQ